MQGEHFETHSEDGSRESGCPFTSPEVADRDLDIAREINDQVITQAGMWGRALLLQLAHPLVATAVAEHGRLLVDPSSGLQRLLRTIDTIRTLMLGSPQEAEHIAQRLHHIHAGVRGNTRDCAGTHRAGTDYRADDRELLRWVYATLVDSALVAHERFVRPLSAAEKDAYCRVARRLGLLVGMLEEDIPENADELGAYIDGMLTSSEIHVTEPARCLADQLFTAPLPAPLRPLRKLAKMAGLADLPPSLREDFGYRWAWGDRLIIDATAIVAPVVRVGLPSVPTALRLMRRSRDDVPLDGRLRRSLA